MIVLWTPDRRGAFQFTKLRGNSWTASWSGEMIATVTLSKGGKLKVERWNSSQPESRVEEGVKYLLAYLASGGDPRSNL